MQALLSEKEVAQVLNVNPRTVRRWRSDGLIPFLKLPGGRIRFNPNTIQIWLQRNCPNPHNAETVIV